LPGFWAEFACCPAHRTLSCTAKRAAEIAGRSRPRGKKQNVPFSVPEIPGVVCVPTPSAPANLEAEDFFEVPANRERILAREGGRCFYCLRQLTKENHVIEHVVSRPVGSNGYRNLVAACRECNNRKKSSADDWLRTLYREGFLDAAEFEERQSHLERLRAGELKPPSAAG